MASTFPAARAQTLHSVGPIRAARAAAGWCPAQLKAMALWPRLDRRALLRAGCDPARIAAHVARRTRLPARSIERLLEQAELAESR